MKKEEVKIYFYYGQDGSRYYTSSVEFAHARAKVHGSNVFYETYMVDPLPEKEKKQ